MVNIAHQKIRDLFNSRVSIPNLIYDFNLFDISVTQKLWSSEQYFKELASLDINNYQIPPSASEIQYPGLIVSQPQSVNTPGYCRQLNRLIDGFFMNSMSSLDTLAHQIATLYTFPRPLDDIYIGSIKKKLLQHHPNSEIAKLLNKQLGQNWFSDFISFRHCTAHESLIMYDIKLSYDQLHYRYEQPEIILPDDPKIRPFTYKNKRRRKATAYCQSVLKHIELLISKAYEKILLDIQTANNVVPIP